MQTLIETCGSLVELSSDGRFQFIHLSVKEYLSQLATFPTLRLESCHVMAATAYLDYLITQVPPEPMAVHPRTAASFSLLAAREWMGHVDRSLTALVLYTRGGKSRELAPGTRQLLTTLFSMISNFCNQGGLLLAWIEICYHNKLQPAAHLLSRGHGAVPSFSQLLGLPGASALCLDAAELATAKQAVSSLAGLLRYLQDVHNNWALELLRDPSMVWREVAAFNKPPGGIEYRGPVEAEILHTPKPQAIDVAEGSLKTISHTTNESQPVLVVLSVWPSK